jgi:magnesium chelatase family protein
MLTFLPALRLAEALETTRIHRVAGPTGDRTALVTTRPCRASHHTISDAGPIGGRALDAPGWVNVTCKRFPRRCRREPENMKLPL